MAGFVAALAGLIAVAATLGLPWREPGGEIAPWVRAVIGVAGALILLGAAYVAGRARPIMVLGLTTLGLSVTTYAVALGVAGAGLGGPTARWLALGGHVLPLTLVQLLPVLAVVVVTGRARRALLGLGTAALVGTMLGVASVLGAPASGVLALGSTVLWFGCFALSPVAAWAGVRGSRGDSRRRAVVAGLASVVTVSIIALCVLLGELPGQGLGDTAAVAALLVGFSISTAATTALVAAATDPRESPLLGRPFVVGLSGGLFGLAVCLLAGYAVLALTAFGRSPALAGAGGIVVTSGGGLVAVRLHRLTASALDPVAELRAALTTGGPVAEGEHRHRVEQALRQVCGDPELVVVVDAVESEGSAVDEAVTLSASPAASGSVPAVGPTVVAFSHLSSARHRLRRMGDLSADLRPTVLEAIAAHERARADSAARDERDRLTQDLHDGLQGRLLGIALDLQLSGRDLDDPNARLLVDQAVAALRGAVEEVRRLAGGRLPDTLSAGGLAPAISELVGPLGSLVDLSVPERRFAPEVEAVGYFVVGEAVANAVKHGRASRVEVRVVAAPGALSVQVADDGVGGADPRLGSGLRGLAERVAASGGVLVVREGAPHGTVVEASVPCGS